MSAAAALPPLVISPHVHIPRSDLWFRFSRSSGPGGQIVIMVDTGGTLYFDFGASAALTDALRRRVRERLTTRITRDGVLYIVASKHRTQSANRRAATERFMELIADALRTRKRRQKTAVPSGARRRRLEDKRRRGAVKTLRRDSFPNSD